MSSLTGKAKYCSTSFFCNCFSKYCKSEKNPFPGVSFFADFGDFCDIVDDNAVIASFGENGVAVVEIVDDDDDDDFIAGIVEENEDDEHDEDADDGICKTRGDIGCLAGTSDAIVSVFTAASRTGSEFFGEGTTTTT